MKRFEGVPDCSDADKRSGYRYSYIANYRPTISPRLTVRGSLLAKEQDQTFAEEIDGQEQ